MAYTNLNYLREMSGGDEEIIQEMKELFIAQIPEFLENMKKFLHDENYLDLGREAHKAKSSVLIMGMEDLARDLKTLQLMTIAGIDKETYTHYIQKFEIQCTEAIKELKSSNR